MGYFVECCRDDRYEHHKVHDGGYKREEYLIDEDIRQCKGTEPPILWTEEYVFVLPSDLKSSEHPSIALLGKCLYRIRSFCQGDSMFLVEYLVTEFSDLDSEIGIFRKRIGTESSCLPDETGSPCTNCSWNHSYTIQYHESTSVEILAHDVFECLPTSHEIHTVSDFCVPSNRSDLLILKMADEVHDRILCEYRIRIECDEYIRIGFGESEIECPRLSGVLYFVDPYSFIIAVFCFDSFVCGIFGSVIHHDNLELFGVIAREERSDCLIDDFLLVVSGNYDRHREIVEILRKIFLLFVFLINCQDYYE